MTDPDRRTVGARRGSVVLLVHLLDRCNLLCEHCYLSAGPRGSTLLPASLVEPMLRQAAGLGVGVIQMSGGEPFLYPKLPDVVGAARQHTGALIRVATNGTLVGDAEAELLRINDAEAQVSIDGPEEFHDRFRGARGAFSRAHDGIRCLVSAGVSVTIVFTVSQENFATLPWLAEWAANLGVSRVSVQPLFALGRGSAIRESRLGQVQLCELFLQLSDLGHQYKRHGLSLSLAYRTKQFLLEHPCAAYVCNGAGCHRKVAKEIKKLVVREDGTVLPEIPTLHRRFALGNLYQDTLTRMVDRYMSGGYDGFDRLCRRAYQQVMPGWTSPIVPWDEIVSEYSQTFEELPASETSQLPAAGQILTIGSPGLTNGTSGSSLSRR